MFEAGLDVVELLELVEGEVWNFGFHFVVFWVVFGFADFEVVVDDAGDVAHFDYALVDCVFDGVVEGDEGFVDAFFVDVFLDFEAVGNVFVEDFLAEVAEFEGGTVQKVFDEVFEGVDVLRFVVPGAVAVFFFSGDTYYFNDYSHKFGRSELGNGLLMMLIGRFGKDDEKE